MRLSIGFIRKFLWYARGILEKRDGEERRDIGSWCRAMMLPECVLSVKVSPHPVDISFHDGAYS